MPLFSLMISFLKSIISGVQLYNKENNQRRKKIAIHLLDYIQLLAFNSKFSVLYPTTTWLRNNDIFIQ